MSNARPTVSLVLCALALLLSGCGPDKAKIVSLLMPVMQRGCDVRQLTVTGTVANGMGVEMLGGGAYSPQQVEGFQRVNTWIEKNTLSSINMRPVVFNPRQREFMYNDDGVVRSVNWLFQYSGPIVTVGASLCVYVPSAINVEDVKVDANDSKLATVTFTVSKKLSGFGEDLLAYLKPVASDVVVSGGSSSMNAMAPQTMLANSDADMGNAVQEHTAVFQRLDASGWRLNTVDGNSQLDRDYIPLPGLLAPYQHNTDEATPAVIDMSAPSFSIRQKMAAEYITLINKLNWETGFRQENARKEANGDTTVSARTTRLVEAGHCKLAIFTEDEFQAQRVYAQNVFSIADMNLKTIEPFGTSPGLVVACAPGKLCVSQEYSDKRGTAGRLPHVSFVISAGTQDVISNDLRYLQNLCGAMDKPAADLRTKN